MKLILAVMFLSAFIISDAQSGDVSLTLNAPVKQETCTPAGDLTDLAGFKVYQLVQDITDPTVTAVVIPDQKPGNHTFIATAYNSAGDESRATQPVSKEVTNFVTKAPNVYYVIAQENTYVLLVVGNVPLGTVCNPDQSVNGKYGISITDVNWTGTVRPLAVVAECG